MKPFEFVFCPQIFINELSGNSCTQPTALFRSVGYIEIRNQSHCLLGNKFSINFPALFSHHEPRSTPLTEGGCYIFPKLFWIRVFGGKAKMPKWCIKLLKDVRISCDQLGIVGWEVITLKSSGGEVAFSVWSVNWVVELEWLREKGPWDGAKFRKGNICEGKW